MIHSHNFFIELFKNYFPLSETMIADTPCLHIQYSKKALATMSACLSQIAPSSVYIGGNTPGSESGTPDPREAREPPDFASHPQEAYDFVCSVLEESIAVKEKYKAKFIGPRQGPSSSLEEPNSCCSSKRNRQQRCHEVGSGIKAGCSFPRCQGGGT